MVEVPGMSPQEERGGAVVRFDYGFCQHSSDGRAKSMEEFCYDAVPLNMTRFGGREGREDFRA